MSALERAKRDEAEGDFGSARRRLMSFVASRGYDADVCERIARLCVRMGDPVEAGRWYFLCDSRDDEAEGCIGRFVESCGGRRDGRSASAWITAHMPPEQGDILLRAYKDAASARVIAQLPRVARHWSLEGFPAAVADRLRGVGLPERPRDTFRVTELSGNWPSRIGCIITAVFLLAFVIGGLATILRWTPGIF